MNRPFRLVEGLKKRYAGNVVQVEMAEQNGDGFHVPSPRQRLSQSGKPGSPVQYQKLISGLNGVAGGVSAKLKAVFIGSGTGPPAAPTSDLYLLSIVFFHRYLPGSAGVGRTRKRNIRYVGGRSFLAVLGFAVLRRRLRLRPRPARRQRLTPPRRRAARKRRPPKRPRTTRT